MGRLPVTPAALAVLMMVAGAVVLAVGVGMWIAPGAGLAVGGVVLFAAGLFGVDVDKGRRRGNR